jgi:RND superfamily putative drug exporter
MISLAKLSIHRPKTALVGWLVVAAVLSLIGLGLSRTLSPPITVVPGTQSSRAQQLAGAQFGPTQLVPILLEGPKAQLNREGPALVAALAHRPRTRVLSAWDAGTASASLRPRPNAAMIVASVDRSERDAVRYDQPQIENLVAHKISRPVTAYITGQPSIDQAEKSASLANLRRDELIAAGILFVLLLVGLRAPVAAVLVTAVGAISMLSGFGLVSLLGHVVSLDPVGVAAGTMTGLALGVGFALLILDRFHREEFPPGGDPHSAATAAMRGLVTTGRAVLVAGTSMILALALVALIGPTSLMVSVGAGALTCAAFATGGAVVVMPAALVLLGRRIDLWRFPAPAPLARAWSGLVDEGNWVTRHAGISGLLATMLLGAIAVPAFALQSGPMSISQLPANSKARIAFEEVSRVMGPGWPTPYNLIVVANDRPITTPALLASLDNLQTQIAKQKAVESVTGPGQINSTSDQLKSFGPQLRHSAKISDQSKVRLLQLIDGLGQAGAGSKKLQAGLAAASSGAGQLHGGSGQAQSGAGQLHTGLAQARAGSAQLQSGLNQALTGAVALKKGAAQALGGSGQLVNGLAQAQAAAKPSAPALSALAGVTANASSAVADAIAGLNSMTTGKSDPHYAEVASQLAKAVGDTAAAKALAATVSSQAPALLKGLDQLHAGAAQLQAGIEQLHNGNAQLATGIGKLAGGGGQLHSGLDQLTAGAGALQIGLGQLTTGAGQLATGLAGGVAPAGQLITGLGTMQAAVTKARGQIPSTASLKQLEAQSPGIFNSGYFVLAAVQGAQRAARNAATFTINLLRGGTAGQIMVVPKYASNDPSSEALGTTLATMGQRFARNHNVQVAVGGPAGSLGDLTSVTKSRIWLDVAVVSIAITLVLALALRALLLPAVATVFGLLVVAASFGLLQILFGGVNPPLGGPGYLDPITIISVFTVAFGLTTTFTSVLLMRTREAYRKVSDSGTRAAVRVGLRETAAATTGTGLVMVAALIPFSLSDLLNIRALGIGVAFAVLLDVVIVRPVLLPAAEAVLGHYGWWPTTHPFPPGPGVAKTKGKLRPAIPQAVKGHGPDPAPR